jgi:large subunit ribosomal protein L4
MELPATIFDAKWNSILVQQVLEAQLANARAPWAHALQRDEVRGGGKKPWRQKGTGRARHGSTRSPIWVGGGKAHGPRNDRDYSQKVNKKMKRTALFAVLSKKAKDGEIKIFDTLVMEAPKTKAVASSLKAILTPRKGDKRFNVLLISENSNKNLFRATNNLQKTKTIDVTSLNVHDIINYKNLFIDKSVVATIESHYKV